MSVRTGACGPERADRRPPATPAVQRPKALAALPRRRLPPSPGLIAGNAGGHPRAPSGPLLNSPSDADPPPTPACPPLHRRRPRRSATRSRELPYRTAGSRLLPPELHPLTRKQHHRVQLFPRTSQERRPSVQPQVRPSSGDGEPPRASEGACTAAPSSAGAASSGPRAVSLRGPTTEKAATKLPTRPTSPFEARPARPTPPGPRTPAPHRWLPKTAARIPPPLLVSTGPGPRDPAPRAPRRGPRPPDLRSAPGLRLRSVRTWRGRTVTAPDPQPVRKASDPSDPDPDRPSAQKPRPPPSFRRAPPPGPTDSAARPPPRRFLAPTRKPEHPRRRPPPQRREAATRAAASALTPGQDERRTQPDAAVRDPRSSPRPNFRDGITPRSSGTAREQGLPRPPQAPRPRRRRSRDRSSRPRTGKARTPPRAPGPLRPQHPGGVGSRGVPARRGCDPVGAVHADGPPSGPGPEPAGSPQPPRCRARTEPSRGAGARNGRRVSVGARPGPQQAARAPGTPGTPGWAPQA
ncbi:proline-rich protein 2-like [Mustela putorius furo]|uniref:Proline-rich protein 2-like n=1 Tax=Mustela putorius furo TaxID=9669 RepID=A0A8U0RWJ9_MUSPF|nr:proline-rich protein 2-like [Mustela putorius furo]